MRPEGKWRGRTGAQGLTSPLPNPAVAMKSKRILEFLAVLVFAAVIAIWFQRSDSPSAEGSSQTPRTPSATANTPAKEAAKPLTLLDGFQLGAPKPDEWPAETELEFDDSGRISQIRGSVLTVDGEVRVERGDSHETVREKVGKPNAFAHGGLYWGYWSLNKPSPSKGLLVKFSTRGVVRLTLAADWIPLSTELALSSGEVVDGSDGYRALREFLAEGKGKAGTRD